VGCKWLGDVYRRRRPRSPPNERARRLPLRLTEGYSHFARVGYGLIECLTSNDSVGGGPACAISAPSARSTAGINRSSRKRL
jgi:hypothetical protein